MRAVLLLILSWAAGLAVYAGAVVGVRGEVLSVENWTVIGTVTLVAWLIASTLVTFPAMRMLASRRSAGSAARLLTVAGVVLTVLPVWLTVGYWYGWHPRNLLAVEAGLLALHYTTSGVVLGLWLALRPPARLTLETPVP